MKNFDYVVAGRVEDAFVSDGTTTMPIAGGTELLNWFRLGIAAPDRIIDLARIDGLDGIRRDGDRLSIGALATLNMVGEDALVAEHAAALGDACLKAASAQVRNRATIGGNVLQKTRCAYFRAEEPLPWGCNKRVPGSGCAAREGLNDRHAILGWTDDCVAVQPSDPVVALAALEAEVELHGPGGRRTLPVADLHLTPAEAARELRLASPQEAARAETRMSPGEVIVAYHLPIRPGSRSAYVKVRERASYEYALVSAAAALTIENGAIRHAAIALGSVALKPWRLPRAEAALIGLAPRREAVLPALRAALAEARPLAHNRYKVALAVNAAGRAIIEAGAKA
jgi:xanthine dehydrogenase YagS FAD-binding subunit